ncbi:MAG TPA: transposase [Gammaproteobacteria bacterium]|nr:transposase [Gammaproteobacteria bacterium]
MIRMDIRAVYPGNKGTSKPNKADRIYPYLLRDIDIDHSNQVWCTDITYLPMARGFAYLVAIMDWHSRKVLSWRVSNVMDADFCIEAPNEAIERYGGPEIFNTDQGSQFTSNAFTGALKQHGIRISMDGKGR